MKSDNKSKLSFMGSSNQFQLKYLNDKYELYLSINMEKLLYKTFILCRAHCFGTGRLLLPG